MKHSGEKLGGKLVKCEGKAGSKYPHHVDCVHLGRDLLRAEQARSNEGRDYSERYIPAPLRSHLQKVGRESLGPMATFPGRCEAAFCGALRGNEMTGDVEDRNPEDEW